jgi:hypothetical protein
MHSPVIISGLLYISAIVIKSFIAIAPLYNNIIVAIGGSLLNINKPSSILTSIVKGF